MPTLAKLLADADLEGSLKKACERFVDVAVPKSMIERFADELILAKEDNDLSWAATLRLRERVDGLYRQLAPQTAHMPAEECRKVIDGLLGVVVKRAIDIVPGRLPPR